MSARVCAMFRLGRRTDAGSAERSIAAVLVAVATFFMVIAVGFVGIISAQYQERLEHDRARVATAWMSAAEPVTSGPRWRVFADAVDSRSVSVVVIVPGPGAPLPPGLTQWPAPGEVVLSPVLAANQDGDVLVARYGWRSPSTIGLDGLVSPTERFVYVRPSAAQEPTTFGYPMTQLGLPWETTVLSNGMIGGAGNQFPYTRVVIGFVLGVVIPALVLVITSMRVASGRRDRRRSVLQVLGARRRDDLAFLAGALIVPVLCGAGAGLLALAIHFVIDLRLPGNGYILQAAYARAHPLWVLGGGVLGAVIAVAVMVGANMIRRQRGTRPRAAARRERAWQLIGLPVAAGIFIAVFLATLHWEDSPARIFVIYGGIGVMALTLPAFVGAACAVCARVLVALGARLGRPSMVVAGRLTLGDPRGVRRLASGLALGIILLAHIMTIGTMTSTALRSAQAVKGAFGDSLLMVSTGLADVELEKEAVTRALTGHGEIVAVSFDRPEDPNAPTVATVTGTCDALTALALECRDGEIDQAALTDQRAVFMTSPAEVRRTAVADPWSRIDREDSALYAISRNGEDLPREPLTKELARYTLPPAALSNVGAMWMEGKEITRSFYDGHLGVAVATTLLLALAVAGAAVGDADVISHRVGALRMWGAGGVFALAVCLGRVMVPLSVAIITGSIAAYATTIIYTMEPMNGYLPPGYTAATVIGPVTVSVAMTAVATVAQARVFTRWRPGRSAA